LALETTVLIFSGQQLFVPRNSCPLGRYECALRELAGKMASGFQALGKGDQQTIAAKRVVRRAMAAGISPIHISLLLDLLSSFAIPKEPNVDGGDATSTAMTTQGIVMRWRFLVS